MTNANESENTRAQFQRSRKEEVLIDPEHESFQREKIFSRTKLERGCVLQKKLDVSSVRIRNSRIVPSKLTLQIHLSTRRFVIVPKEKREELVAILDDQIKRLMKMINSNRTKTKVRLRAVQVLAELIRTSYTMVRDEEVEELERETEKLEKEEKRSQTEDKTEDKTEEEPAKPA
jgi:ribosome-associated translation inhibitor RaiA